MFLFSSIKSINRENLQKVIYELNGHFDDFMHPGNRISAFYNRHSTNIQPRSKTKKTTCRKVPPGYNGKEIDRIVTQ